MHARVCSTLFLLKKNPQFGSFQSAQDERSDGFMMTLSFSEKRLAFAGA